MRNRVLVWAAGLGLLAVPVAFLCWSPNSKPEYPGRALTHHTLEQWLELATRGATPRYFTEQAEDAVRTAGTNALPTLLEWTRYRAGPFVRFSNFVLSVAPLPRNLRAAIPNPLAREMILEIYAATGFRILNTNAAPAIPVLARLARQADFVVARRAVRALGDIGVQSVPDLVQVVNTPDSPARAEALWQLARFSPVSRAVEQVMLQSATNSVAEVSRQAAFQLPKIGAPPEAIVPALIAALGSPDPRTRSTAADSLGELGPSASNAVTALQARLADPSRRVRLSASNALLTILPNLEIKTGTGL